MKHTCADCAHYNKKDYRHMKPNDSRNSYTTGTQTATTAASASNAATGVTANAHKATGRCRIFCSATTACSFVARSRKYLLGAEAEVMA